MSPLAIAAGWPGRDGCFAGLGDTKPCVPHRAAHYRFFGHRCRAYGRLRWREGSWSCPYFGRFVRSQVKWEYWELLPITPCGEFLGTMLPRNSTSCASSACSRLKATMRAVRLLARLPSFANSPPEVLNCTERISDGPR